MAPKLSQEETLAAITAKSKQNDSFIVKVFRKRHVGGLPESVAILHDAQAGHIVSPEVWLPRLCGGGPLFLLQVFHIDDQTAPIGDYLQLSVPTETLAPKSANEIDVSIVRTGSWNGPRSLIYPTKEDRKSSEAPLFGISSGLPPAPPPGNSAANVNVPGGGQPGALYPQRDPIADRNNAVLAEIQTAQARFDRMKEEWAEEQRRKKDELAEEKRRMELDGLRKENELRQQQMEARMTAALEAARSANQAPKVNVAELLTAVSGILAPLLLKMAEAGNESRRLAAETNTTLMTAMLTRPSVDPVVERIFSEMKSFMERSASQQTAPSTMLHSMAEAMGAMTSTTMELVHAAADLNLGGGKQEDHPALKAIREAVKGINSMFSGYQAALPRPPVQPGQPYPQAQLAPPPGFGQPPAAPFNPAAAGVPPAGATQYPPPRDVLEYLEQMFKQQVPVQDVVGLFIKSIDDPVVRRALDEVDGEIEELFSRRLQDFVLANPGHVPYMRALFEEMDRQGEAAGLFDGGDVGEEEEEESEGAAA